MKDLIKKVKSNVRHDYWKNILECANGNRIQEKVFRDDENAAALCHAGFVIFLFLVIMLSGVLELAKSTILVAIGKLLLAASIAFFTPFILYFIFGVIVYYFVYRKQLKNEMIYQTEKHKLWLFSEFRNYK